MKITVIGATGMLGAPVTKQLIASGFDVSIAGRDPGKIQKLFPGAKVVHADVFDENSLRTAFTGQQLVYINLSITQVLNKKRPQPEREGIENIIKAAGKTGIRRLIYLSSLVQSYNGMNGFKWWAFDIKQAAIEKIKASGIDHTIFYPSTFMETLLKMMVGKRLALMGRSVAPMWFIAAEDYARQVARSLETATGNKEYNVQGPEPFTFDEAAKVFIENYRKARLKTMRIPLGPVKFFGNFNGTMNYAANICKALNKYPERFVSESAWQELGKPAISLKQYAGQL